MQSSALHHQELHISWTRTSILITHYNSSKQGAHNLVILIYKSSHCTIRSMLAPREGLFSMIPASCSSLSARMAPSLFPLSRNCFVVNGALRWRVYPGRRQYAATEWCCCAELLPTGAATTGRNIWWLKWQNSPFLSTATYLTIPYSQFCSVVHWKASFSVSYTAICGILV